MDTLPALGLAILLLLLIVAVVATAGLFMWGRRVAMWHASAGWGRAAFLPFAAPVLFIAGIAITMVRLILGFREVASSASGEKATVLSQHIASAMVSTWVGLLIGGLVMVGSVVLFLVGTIRRPRNMHPEYHP